MPTYAFKSVNGSFVDPDVGVFLFAGQVGVKHISISQSTDRTAHDTASDGVIMVSYMSGSSGTIDIELQQTSSFNQFLVNWANIKFTQADLGNATTFASAKIKVIDLLSGAVHTLTGVSPTKIPDKSYGPAGQMVTWHLMAAGSVTQ